ncbi:hypothetical protein DL98DRAFT_541066 [Cadophora sp. DSE1049]|nr:hypothetical protein DL98DRAFT_541066 [Cadophora sp. DSE1049]
MAATSEIAVMSGSFSRGPASWNIPTPSMLLGGKNLEDAVNDRKHQRGEEAGKPRSESIESATNSQTPRKSVTKDTREASEIRSNIRGRGSRTQIENWHVRVVSPPTEENELEEKPAKGILRTPKEKFPEDQNFVREGVAPSKGAKENGIPLGARWTKIRRELVNPEALGAGKERGLELPAKQLKKKTPASTMTVVIPARRANESERNHILNLISGGDNDCQTYDE